MPADAMSALQTLAQRLGRQPTLEELYQFIGVTPSGTPQLENPVAQQAGEPDVRRSDERQDGRLTASLRVDEILRHNPELRLMREDLIRRLLYGMPAGPTMGGLMGGAAVGPHGGSSPALDVTIDAGGLSFSRHP